MLANKDATVEIVGVVRDVFEIAHIEPVRSRSGVGTIVRMLSGTLRGSFHD
jgi:pantoate kinase